MPSPVFFRSPHPLDVVNNLSAASIALTLSSFSIPLFLANRLELIALVCHSLNDVCHVGNETGNTGRCKNIRRKKKIKNDFFSLEIHWIYGVNMSYVCTSLYISYIFSFY